MIVLCTMALAGPAWAADPADPRDFYVAPKIGVQESFTDNALLTAANTKIDAVTRLQAGGDVYVNTGRTKATINGAVTYDQYANNGSLSGWSLYGTGTGSYAIVPSALTLEAEGTVTNGTVSTFGTSAIDRAGTAGRVQLATYDIGPRYTSTLGDFADVNLLGRFAQVLYDVQRVGNTGILPADSSFMQFNSILGTGTRFSGYELTNTANYLQDDHGFELYNATQSVFVGIVPHLRLIMRGGYEDVSQPGVVQIDAPIASAGLELSINQLSKITLEGGNRYNRASWTADVFLQISDRIYVTARYFEILEPPQIQISDSFSNFLNVGRQAPILPTTTSFSINGNLYNQTSLNKVGEAHIVYRWQEDNIDFDASWNDQRFFPANDHDRVLVGNASYFHRLAPDFGAMLRLSYAQTFASPIYGANSGYGGELSLSYDLNSRMTARAGYAADRQTQTRPTHESISENILFISVERRM